MIEQYKECLFLRFDWFKKYIFLHIFKFLHIWIKLFLLNILYKNIFYIFRMNILHIKITGLTILKSFSGHNSKYCYNPNLLKVWGLIRERKYLAPTNEQESWFSQTCYFLFKKLFYPLLIICINGTCMNLFVEKTPVHSFKQIAKTRVLSKVTRDNIVHMRNTGMSQSTVGKQLIEER